MNSLITNIYDFHNKLDKTESAYVVEVQNKLKEYECSAKENIKSFNKMIDEIEAAAIQEDAPIYEGDKEVDYYVRLSGILEVVEKYKPHI